ncbi:chromosome 7 open reading frame 55 [Nesidiocoris tenuis]|uniref:Protein FMC1 homolog n=1 Tax=Nesidiocoris tenuis TaxID=355587 RepID=A0ABN7BBF3_9HEMI|nr:chromosome 7 open reading frame 55 [Nesidiocoris tenuis]
MNGYRYSSRLKTLRHLLSELRQCSSTGKIADVPVGGYVLSQFKRFRTIDESSRSTEEMTCLMNAYVTYLSSIRNYKEIFANYFSKKSLGIRETANMVGFELPQDSTGPIVKP